MSVYRRLGLISSSSLRDCRISLRRYSTKRLMSSIGDFYFSCNVTKYFHIDGTKSHSVVSNRWHHQRRPEATRRYSVIVSVPQTMLKYSTSIGRIENSAGFHSSPLSWFTAEAEGANSTEDTSSTAAESEESVPDDIDDNEEQSVTDVTYDISPPAPLSQVSKDKVQAIFDKVLWLDMIEVHLLTQIVNEQMGISWRETVQRRMGGGVITQRATAGEAAGAEAVEEKTIFDLKLVGFDAKAKIKVIKEVRTIAGLGLKEAKEMVEGVPKVVQKELKQEKAEELKSQLEAVGAQVELV